MNVLAFPAVGDCLPPPVIEKARLKGQRWSHGVSLVVSCFEGHRFEDGRSWKWLNCSRGQWNEIPTKCVGESKSMVDITY